MRRPGIVYRELCEAARVVKPDPVLDHAFGLEPALQFMQIDGLLFERSPQPFDEDIVEITTPSIHGYFDIGLGQGVTQAAPVNCDPWTPF